MQACGEVGRNFNPALYSNSSIIQSINEVDRLPGPATLLTAPFTGRSSSPKPQSLMLKVAVLPTIVAGETYQCGVGRPAGGRVVFPELDAGGQRLRIAEAEVEG